MLNKSKEENAYALDRAKEFHQQHIEHQNKTASTSENNATIAASDLAVHPSSSNKVNLRQLTHPLSAPSKRALFLPTCISTQHRREKQSKKITKVSLPMIAYIKRIREHLRALHS